MLCEPHGRDTVTNNEQTSNSALAVVPGKESVSVSRVSTRSGQPYRRPGIQENPIVSRVETEGGGVSADNGINGRVLRGPVCFSAQCSAEAVCELETRSPCNGNRCPTNFMERVDGVCLPTFLSDRQMPEEGQGRQGVASVGSPNMEVSTMVPSPAGTSSGILPGDPDLLMDPAIGPHLLAVAGQLRLAAWKLSGISSRQQEFLERLPNSWPQDGVTAQTKYIRVPGKDGIAGVRNNKLIPFLALSTPSWSS